MASFRPSVLPDRDNDILSTFTRSFERARQSRLRDQADKRAQSALDMQREAHDQSLQLARLSARERVATTPGFYFGAGPDGQRAPNSDIEAALASVGSEVDPRLDFGSNQPMAPGTPQAVTPGRATLPDVQEIGRITDEDAPVNYSQFLANYQEGETARRRGALQDEIGGPARARQTLEEARTVEQRRETVRMFSDLLDIETEGDAAVDLSGDDWDPDPLFDVIEARVRGQEARATDAAAPPRAGSTGTTPQERFGDDVRGEVERIYDDAKKEWESYQTLKGQMDASIGGMDQATLQSMMDQPEPSRADFVERATDNVLATNPAMAEYADEIRAALQASFSQGVDQTQVDQTLNLLRGMGSVTDATSARTTMEANGVPPDVIEAVIAKWE